jgi:hypothetical protein
VNALTLLRNIASRLIAVQEALEVGDTGEAFTLLVDLEADVVGGLAALSMEEAT